MPLLQVRDCPEDIYRKISLDAKRRNRTIAQQILVLLGKALGQDESNAERRRQLLERIQARKVPEKALLFREAIRKSSWVIAPDLFVSELSKVAWKYCRAKAISHSEAIQLAEDGITLIDDFIQAEELWKEALAEGIKRRHSVFDLLYATLARRNDAVIITNDRALADVCRKMHVTICI